MNPHLTPDTARASSLALVLGAVISVQCGAAAATTLFDRVGPVGTVTLRIGLAALALTLLWRPRVRGHSGPELRLAATFGLVLAGMNLAFYEALDRIPLGIAVTLEFTGPLAVAVLGSRRALDLVWVALAATGIVLLSPGGSGSVDLAGAAFALIAGAFWAAYILIAARVGRAFRGGEGLALAMIVATLPLLPFGLAAGGIELFAPAVLAVGAAVALLSSAIPYSLELEALRRIPERTFGVLMSTEPAVAALVGLVALGQDLQGREVVAITLIVLASAGALGTSPSRAPIEG